MKKRVVLAALAVLGGAACSSDDLIVDNVEPPDAPRALDAFYYAGAVTVTWELGPRWNGEAFRVYSKRLSDADFFLIAEVTSCAADACEYKDVNVVPGQTYRYYVAAVDAGSGVETPTDNTVDVEVPQPIPPPVPDGVRVIALDHADYVTWGTAARSADDFSFYRVYLAGSEGNDFLLGETDSEGFLDLLALNGSTYTYYVTSVDDQGHESAGSTPASGTPRPDFHGEWIYAFGDQPALSGFRFQADEATDPIVSGTSSSRHFRLEVDDAGWWLAPGPDAGIYPLGFETTALKCGPGADASCVDVDVAPATGYVLQRVALDAQSSYVLRVRGDDGRLHYGVIRVEMLGFDGDGNALMIFDWAYQLQPDNLSPPPPRG